MEFKDVLKEVKSNLTGDPEKDGPYLKKQSEKYKSTKFSSRLDREFSEIILSITEKKYKDELYSFLDQENNNVNEQLKNAQKRYDNLNYNGGIKILEEIIKNNILAWNDTDKVTYKCFGTPLEYLLYKNLFEDKNSKKEIKSVNCNLAKVYWMYARGLTKKKRYDEALSALERAKELNPVDPELYIYYSELAKASGNMETLKMCCDMLLKCGVTKDQVGSAYFNYSFYYSETGQFDKALALLQMSHIFKESELYASELEYITNSMGLGRLPQMYNTDQLMNILLSENIQPGPSAAVVSIANSIAKDFEKELELKYAKYFYDIVYELTEDQQTLKHIQELSKNINDMKNFS